MSADFENKSPQISVLVPTLIVAVFEMITPVSFPLNKRAPTCFGVPRISTSSNSTLPSWRQPLHTPARGGATVRNSSAHLCQFRLKHDSACRVWHSFAQRVVKDELSLVNDPTLISQLTTRKTTIDARGRLGIEKKADMAASGVKSPDRADAVVGAFFAWHNEFRGVREKDGP